MATKKSDLKDLLQQLKALNQSIGFVQNKLDRIPRLLARDFYKRVETEDLNPKYAQKTQIEAKIGEKTKIKAKFRSKCVFSGVEIAKGELCYYFPIHKKLLSLDAYNEIYNS